MFLRFVLLLLLMVVIGWGLMLSLRLDLMSGMDPAVREGYGYLGITIGAVTMIVWAYTNARQEAAVWLYVGGAAMLIVVAEGLTRWEKLNFLLADRVLEVTLPALLLLAFASTVTIMIKNMWRRENRLGEAY